MTISTKFNSASAEIQLTTHACSPRPRESRISVTPRSDTVVRSTSPNEPAVPKRKISNSGITQKLAKLEIEATETMRAYVFEAIDYISALSVMADVPASVTVKVGHFRRQGLSVNERLDDFIQSTREIVSLLTDCPRQPSRESDVPPNAKLLDNSQGILAALKKLSPRENDVLELLVKGLPNKQIGYELGISVTTAKAHIGVILRKLHVSNRARVIALLANIDCAAKASRLGGRKQGELSKLPADFSDAANQDELFTVRTSIGFT